MTTKNEKTTIAAERLDNKGFFPPWTVKEHEERYQFAAAYCKGLNVCDCACGSGMGTKKYHEAGAHSITGVDVSPNAIISAPKLDGVTYIEGSAENLPFPNESFEFIVSFETIEHVENPQKVIQEFSRCLKPNGLLLISTPNRLVTNPLLPPKGKPWNPYHVREFSPTEFTDLISAEFHNLQTFGQNQIKPSVLRLKTLIANQFGTTASIRMGQIAKCFWPFLKPNDFHKVKKTILDTVEYMVVVAHKI